MGLQMDKEYAAAVAPIQAMKAKLPKWEIHDVEIRRKAVVATMMGAANPEIPDEIEHEIHTTPTSDGFQLPIWRFAKKSTSSAAEPGPAALHLHGGGYIAGTPAVSVESICHRVLASGVSFFSVDYRLAPESQYPQPLEDCWVALQWLVSNAKTYNIDPARIVVMGESAGGGLAAGLTLLARDRGHSPPIARQILTYPMLDDRNTEDLAPGVFSIWDGDSNLTGWTAYLGSQKGTETVPIYAAAARADDVRGLPPLYLDVGQLDLFAKEDHAYVKKFLDAGIEVEYHIYPGLSHGFSRMVPNHLWTRVQKENWIRQLQLV